MGRVWGGFGEAKNLDFRTFFNVFSKSFLKCVSKRHKSAILEAKRAGPIFHVDFWEGSVEWRDVFGYAKSTASTAEHFTVSHALASLADAADLVAPPFHRPLVRSFVRSSVRSVVRPFVRSFGRRASI